MHRWACKARLASLETQVSGAAARLTDLPAEVLGLICRPLSLKDRCGRVPGAAWCSASFMKRNMLLLLPTCTSTQ